MDSSQNAYSSQTQLTLAQHLKAFFADDENEEAKCSDVCSEVVLKETMFYETEVLKEKQEEARKIVKCHDSQF